MRINNRCKREKSLLVCGMAVVLVLVITVGISMIQKSGGVVYAAEDTTGENDEIQNKEAIQMLYANADTSLYESADEQSNVLKKITRGEVVLLVSDNGEWCEVQVGELRGYIVSGCLQKNTIDEELQKEMEDLSVYNTAYIDELERLKAERRRSRIFGGIIIALIIGIFGSGIFITIRKKVSSTQQK